MPPEPGKPKRKPPERADALKIDLPFEEAIRAALDAKPGSQAKKPASKRSP